MTKNEIKKLIHSKKSLTRESVFRKAFPDLYDEIRDAGFPDGFVFGQKLYHWLFDDIELSRGTCPVCGNRCGFISFFDGYRKHCSCRCSSSDEQVQKLFAKTCESRYGENNPAKVIRFREKAKNTCRKKFGTDYASQSDDFKENMRKRLERDYGTDNVSRIPEVKEKKRETCLRNNGCDNPMRSEKIKKRAMRTNIRRYGTPNAMQCEYVRKRAEATCVSRYGVPYGVAIKRQVSALETEIREFISENYTGEIIFNDRKVLAGRELDIYLPEIKTAFEVNGDYWHMNPESFGPDDINAVTGKTARDIWAHDEMKKAEAEKLGLKIICIWESDWRKNRESVKRVVSEIISR